MKGSDLFFKPIVSSKALIKNLIRVRRFTSFLRQNIARSWHTVPHHRSSHIATLLKEGVPYTFVILQDRVVLAETSTKHPFKELFTIHVLLAEHSPELFMPGTLTRRGDEIHFDNNSGSYLPEAELLKQAEAYWYANFPDQTFVANVFESKK